MAVSNDWRLVAVGEGSESSTGNSIVYLYDIEKQRLLNRIPFHQKGIQSMCFSADGKYLVTLGVKEDKMLAVADIGTGLIV